MVVVAESPLVRQVESAAATCNSLEALCAPVRCGRMSAFDMNGWLSKKSVVVRLVWMRNKLRMKKKHERTSDPGGHALDRLHQFELERGLPLSPKDGRKALPADDEMTEQE
jgi:hypothetical protein